MLLENNFIKHQGKKSLTKTYILQFVLCMDGQLTKGEVKYKLAKHQFPTASASHTSCEAIRIFPYFPLITCFYLLLCKGTHKDSLYRVADMQPVCPTVSCFFALTYACDMSA